MRKESYTTEDGSRPENADDANYEWALPKIEMVPYDSLDAMLMALNAGDTGRAHEDDVVGFGDVRAGGQPRNHGLVQAAIRVILNVLHAGTGVGEMSSLFQPCQLVVLSGAPFPVHQEADTILKGHIVVGGIL